MIIYIPDYSKYHSGPKRKISEIYDGWIMCDSCGERVRNVENFREWPKHFLKNEACPVKVYKQIGKSLSVVEKRKCSCYEKVEFNIFDILKDHLKEIFT